MRYYLLFLLICCGAPLCAQTTCNYIGVEAPPAELNYATSEEARKDLRCLLDKIGLNKDISIIVVSNYNGACAQAYGEPGAVKEVIYLDPDYLSRMRDRNYSGRWSDLGILAHELGHLVLGHLRELQMANLEGMSTAKVMELRRSFELKADEFAGRQLCRLGATESQALASLQALDPYGSESHPARSERIEAARRGYKQNHSLNFNTVSLDPCLGLTLPPAPDAPSTRDLPRDLPPTPEMVFIKGGSFYMESLYKNDSLDDFYLGKYEVTFEEYDAFCDATKRPKPNDQGWGRGRRPVINVTWYAAREYAKWLSEQSGLNYHLPSEAQWEYAAGGGASNRTEYPGTPDKYDLVLYAWNRDNAEDKTQPVGQRRPNVLGLYDLGGNVWEWTSEDHVSNEGTPRFLRGGSWFGDPQRCRVACRYSSKPDRIDSYIGFRLARTP